MKQKLSEAERKRRKAESNRRWREKQKTKVNKVVKQAMGKTTEVLKKAFEAKRVKSLSRIDRSDNYEIILEDGSKSKITILKHQGEYVLQGDSRQRFCESELLSIIQEISKLNKSATNEKELIQIEDDSENKIEIDTEETDEEIDDAQGYVSDFDED